MKNQLATNALQTKVWLATTAILATIGFAGVTLATAQQPSPPTPPAIQAPPSPSIPAPAPATQPASFLAWDADGKNFDAKPGEVTARFTFYVTNVSSEIVIITNLQRSCGCTEATMPAQPWNLAPGARGPILATIDLRGKGGRISKALTVNSSAGAKVLMLNVNIPPPTPTTTSLEMDRARNQQTASQDRQAVFKGECAACHATPTVAKMGEQLYQAGCAICHDAEHRAAIVPNLRALNHPTNADHWRQWITESKPGSLMPAFSKAHDGPLTDEQIGSLVDYLTRAIPNRS